MSNSEPENTLEQPPGGERPSMVSVADCDGGQSEDATIPHPQTGGKKIWNAPPYNEENDLVPFTQDREFNEDVNEQSDILMTIPPRSEWDDSEEESEDEAIDVPESTDIRSDFERVLNGPLDFQGSYYFHKIYNEFPNPLLRLDSLGHIGLPLSSREAKHVINCCVQAPFGQGERTLVDKTVRDTWEMDASQIHFDNPAWKTFMNKFQPFVVNRTNCYFTKLDHSVSSLLCLFSLTLLSSFLPHQDTEKTKGMFATIVVVLPSPFQGGAAHLSHGELSTIIDSSSQSLSNVSVLAWYTDVMHEIKPVTSGYRLAISFNLIQTTNSRPTLPETSDFLNKLRHVLLSWKRQPDSNVPAKLIYLLQYKYSLASFRGDCLKGGDAYKVAILEGLAKQLKFDVGLANVECHLAGYGDGGYGSEDDDDVGMAEVEERNMSIGNLVDLDGRRIQHELDCEEDDSEFCPKDLRHTIEDGEPDEREYEGYQGNGAGSLELWYRRTVLVVWPHRRNAEMVYGDDPGDALSVLTSGDEDDEECRLLAKFLLRGIASGRFGDSIVQGLCKTAVRWNNLPLWLKTLDVCDATKILEILSARRIVEAIEVFGFDEGIRDVLVKMLTESPSNKSRIHLLDAIMAGAGQVDSNWLARQRYQVMKSLKQPICGEEELLVKLTVEGGGVPFLKSIILPQIVSTADAAFFVAFSRQLVIEHSLQQTAEYISTIKSITRDLLTHAIEKTEFFSPPSSALAYSFIEACAVCNHGDLAELVIDKLAAASATSDTALTRTCDVLVPLVSQLKASSERPIPGLVKLCRVTAENYTKYGRGRTPTDTELSTILDAIVGAEDTTLLPKLVDQLSQLPPNLALCRSLITHLRSREGSLIFGEGGLSGICTQAVNNLVQRTQYNSNLPLILSHFQLCISTDNIPSLSQLFPRILSPAVVNQRYISEVLLPLLPKILVELAGRNMSPTAPPIGPVFKQVFELYASGVLGPKTSDHRSLVESVKKWPSCCNDCATVVKFFLHSQDRQMRLSRIGMPQRKHVEQRLAQFCGYRIGNWSTIKTSPQGLEVNKSELLYSSIVWSSRQSRLKEVLKSVSKEALLELFSGDYERFMKSIGEPVEPEAGPPPAKKRRVTDSTEVIDLCNNAESDRYYHASRAALALRSVFDSPEMATVQAVLLMGAYHNMGGRSYTMESSWSLICLGSKLAQSLGLHRDSARWNMDPKTVNQRRALFWELFSAELFQSVALGRPPSIRLSYVDCEFPTPEDQTLDENGNPRIGYYEWKYTFGRDVFSVITERTLTAESPTYETVLELDRLVRAKTLPAYLNVFLGREDENCTPSVYMRGCLLGQYRSIALLYIHRTFFARAMLDHPVNPLRSPYAPSFLAAYRCASGMIKANLNHFERWWVIWTHLFSAAIIVGCIVTRSPSSSMAPTAFIELGLACDLFEKGAKSSRRARSGLAILCKLREKAFEVYSQFRSGNPTPPPTSFSPGLFDYGEDELALFGGQTRVMVSKLVSRKAKGKDKDQASKESHPPTVPSTSSASTPSTMSDDVHPSLVDYLSLFPPAESFSVPLDRYYVDPDTPPKDLSHLGMLMAGDSGIDEQWNAFMKKSFSGLFDENMPPPTGY
ncbi:Zn(2)-C6 fungal-type domain-containing protein [Mycena sanguinolenta]|uniref:Zn(2)-C6 fungal-type domain-containing protein n=1 Tax=Mycena sanguinolenta TaxID=230812 RepID=A0A8H6YA41_9AGAR|nr:Zn(2)-C6 fungal-type domain-containing protein [Mycena sanguinolenta]